MKHCGLLIVIIAVTLHMHLFTLHMKFPPTFLPVFILVLLCINHTKVRDYPKVYLEYDTFEFLTILYHLLNVCADVLGEPLKLSLAHHVRRGGRPKTARVLVRAAVIHL